MRRRNIPAVLLYTAVLLFIAAAHAFADNPPLVATPSSVNGAENSLTSFVATASDPDGDPIADFLMSPISTGATFTRNATMTSGTFSWIPSFSQSGVYTFTFTATNALSGAASTQITIQNTDRAPVVTAPASVTGSEGSPLTFAVNASDPDGDPITSLTSSLLPSGATFSSDASHTSGTFDWTPAAGQAGNYTVSFTATNTLSGRAFVTIGITTAGGDRVPVVVAPATAHGAENILITFTVNASDPDGDAILSLTAAGPAITAGGTFTANASNTSGTFSWTPNFAQTGIYAVTFTASNALSASATTTIQVGGPDRAPVVLAPATASLLPNTLVTFTVSAIDPDGDAIVSLTAAPLPSGATFASNAAHTSGTFAWIPTNAQQGTYNVTFTASNALSGSYTTAITVLFSDRPPVVTAPATAIFGENVFGSFTVSASDPDGEAINSLTASGTAITAGAVFASNAAHTSGTLSWTPTFGQMGSYSATFTASNALSGSATTSITVGQLFTPPVVTAPATVTGSEGTLITFTVTASDPDDAITSFTASPLPPGATFSTNATHTSGTFAWTPTLSQAGTYPVTFLASNSLSGSATTTITVQDVCQQVVANAGGPYSGALNAPMTFDGSLSTGTVLSYQWDFGDGATGSGVTPTHIYLAAGVYSVSLTVQGACGSPSTAMTTATVNEFCALAFTTGGNKSLRLDSGKPAWCAQVEPTGGCYSNTDVNLASIVMQYSGGAVSEIRAGTDKSAISGDKNQDGIDEITACFQKSDLRQLFSALPSGENTVTVTIRMGLVTGGQVAAQLTLRVFSSGQALAASVTPNPFNPRAMLSFRTASDGFARARLFDSSGRLVRTLLDERMLVAGYHEVPLDGRGNTGEALASGIYLYRLETAQGTAGGRVVLLK